MIPLNANSLSERKGDLRSRKIARFGLVISLFIVLNTAFLKIDSVYANTTNHYRQWAFIQLNDLDEFYCLDELYFRESRWNPKARDQSPRTKPKTKGRDQSPRTKPETKARDQSPRTKPKTKAQDQSQDQDLSVTQKGNIK